MGKMKYFECETCNFWKKGTEKDPATDSCRRCATVTNREVTGKPKNQDTSLRSSTTVLKAETNSYNVMHRPSDKKPVKKPDRSMKYNCRKCNTKGIQGEYPNYCNKEQCEKAGKKHSASSRHLPRTVRIWSGPNPNPIRNTDVPNSIYVN